MNGVPNEDALGEERLMNAHSAFCGTPAEEERFYVSLPTASSKCYGRSYRNSSQN